MCVLSESVTGNDCGKFVLDALEPIDIFYSLNSQSTEISIDLYL